MRHSIGILAAVIMATTVTSVQAEEYVIDTDRAHAFIQFKISHLGYSWVLGRFNTFSGKFSYDDQNPGASKVKVEIDVGSVDTNEAERDKHLRGEHYLDADRYPKATFVSTGFKQLADGKAELTGDLTLHGVTKPITIAVNQIGHGPDPWGGYRRGFDGTTSFKLADFGITPNLGPAAETVHLFLSVEGIRQ